MIIENNSTTGSHFAQCNNSRCNAIFLVNPLVQPTDLGYLCPECKLKTDNSHIVQCSSCKTVLNFVRASTNEKRMVFNVNKCSHCIGTIEDEWEVEPIYNPESYI